MDFWNNHDSLANQLNLNDHQKRSFSVELFAVDTAVKR
jgi:hypothetical protein